MEIKENVSLAPYTVFKIGGQARFFTEVRSAEELRAVLLWASQKGLPYFILGLGSNILVSDSGFSGLVIKMENRELRQEGEKDNCLSFSPIPAGEFPMSRFKRGEEIGGGCVIAGAGVRMAEVVNFAERAGLTGFEWGIGIPGTVGGSVRGNAGCFGGEMKDVVVSVKVFDLETKTISVFPLSSCEFAYRRSVFKERPGLIVLEVRLRLKEGEKGETKKRIAESVKTRIRTQEIGSKCAGCIFKNPREDVAAAALIDELGLKGTRIGGALISTKHANFIINTGSATAEDIIILIGLIKERVHRTFDILLEEEIQLVGFE